MEKLKIIKAERPRILLVESDISLAHSLSDELANNYFCVDIVRFSDEVLSQPLVRNYEVLIFGSRTLCICQYDFFSKIRKYCCVPIIVYSLINDDIDEILLLEMGADYYISSCSTRKLITYIRVALRKYEKLVTREIGKKESIHFYEKLYMDLSHHICLWDDESLNLTQTEIKIMEQFVINSGEILSTQYLSESVFGKSMERKQNQLRVYISNINKKLIKISHCCISIYSVRKQGYILKNTRLETNKKPL